MSDLQAAAQAVLSAGIDTLTDAEIDSLVGNLGVAQYTVLIGPTEIRAFARRVLAARQEKTDE